MEHSPITQEEEEEEEEEEEMIKGVDRYSIKSAIRQRLQSIFSALVANIETAVRATKTS